MSMNILPVIVATIGMFFVGGVWYGALFSKNWARLHGMGNMGEMTSEERKVLMKETHVGVLYGFQVLITLFNAFALSMLIHLPNVNWFSIALLTWFGFLLPAETSAVLFGQKMSPRNMTEKVAISVGGGFIANLVGAFIISLF